MLSPAYPTRQNIATIIEDVIVEILLIPIEFITIPSFQ